LVPESAVRIRAVAVAALAVTAVAMTTAAVSTAAEATSECRGLQVCIPVAGPWVVVPAAKGVAVAQWELKCPEGVVAGLDARVSDPRIGIKFSGRLGSPVNPGITTTDRVVFTARYTGGRNTAMTFRPFIGCVPVRGGGRRTPTAAAPSPGLVPAEPITTRVMTVPVYAGALSRVSHRCQRGEHLLHATYAVGLYTKKIPTPAERLSVNVVHRVVEEQILVSATRRGLPRNVRAEVQLHAECTR
jgi:hypothetical protein